MPKYIILPIGSYAIFTDIANARKAAREATEQYGGTVAGFEILEATQLGRYEHCSPIWIDAEWEKSRDYITNEKLSDTPRLEAAASPAQNATPTPESTTLSGHPQQAGSAESESANPVDIPF